ncbi:diguanylate cyclase [Pseudoalteromonas sp. DL-6]|uniref:tetratricopeptide repeat-containing diguanylate cyclase n=1 Tax=Pseudoalteromonas sp. DL-6 TaxID=1390185 RepID=UPI0010C34B8F|nr:diguanylate cyclase [Pseudoalteromonas sp. DL-6]QBJ63647.1 hypothetical protein B1F84_11710 [Pseudoalteromonas sp. DL-6]
MRYIIYLIYITSLFISFIPHFVVAKMIHRDEIIESQLNDIVDIRRYPTDITVLKEITKRIDKNSAFETYIRAKGNLILWQGLKNKEYNTAIKHAQQLYQESLLRSSVNAQVEMLAVQCEIFFQQGKTNEYMALFPILERHLEKVDNPRLLFYVHLLISRLWQNLSQQESSLKHILLAQDAARKLKDRFQLKRRLQLNILIARNELALQHYAKAENLLVSSIKEAELHQEQDQLAELYLLLGFVNQHILGPTDESIKFYLKAVQWSRKNNNSKVLLMALNNIGANLLLQQKYQQAEQYFHNALKILSNTDVTNARLVINFNLGYLQVLQGQKDIGIRVMVENADAFRKVARPVQISDLLTHLADAYGRTGQYQSQATTLKEKLKLLQKHHSDESERIANEMQIRYQSNDKILQVELLEQTLELQKYQNESQQRIMWMSLGLILAILAVLTVIFFSYRKVKSVNKQISEKNVLLHQLSLHDPLTGLNNRRSVELTPEREQKGRFYNTKHCCQPSNNTTALLVMLDIDFFKHINDNYGHAVGDEVLLAFSMRFKQFCRSNDKILRWGGEEFLLLLENVDANKAQQTIHKLLQLLCVKPIETEAGALNISVSGGFLLIDSVTPTNQRLWDWQLKFVDSLLYRAKKQGRNRLYGWLVSPEYHAQKDAEAQQLQIESDLELIIGPEKNS